ncbi:MAG: hypothetical protein Q8O39_01050 [bacterium]|nr:hypothetical protein [bacterium]
MSLGSQPRSLRQLLLERTFRNPVELGLEAKRKVNGMRTEPGACRWSKRTGGSEKKELPERHARSVSETFFSAVFLRAKNYFVNNAGNSYILFYI